MVFSRMAAYLASKGMDVTIVDYPDGAMARRVRGMSGIRLHSFEDGVPTRIGGDGVVVLQSLLPATIRPELRIDPAARLLFWTLHPANFIQVAAPISWIRDLQMRSRIFHDVLMKTVMHRFAVRLRTFVLSLDRGSALLFMDRENYRVTSERVGVVLRNPIFVPVPSDRAVVNRVQEVARAPRSPLSIAWLGRLAQFKVHILLHMLDRFSRLARERRLPLRFQIIGDGPDRWRIRTDRFEHEYFTVEWKGRLTEKDLDDYLVENIDILAAMGTSALEGARLGLPTILLDFSYRRIRGDYVFRWLHQTKDYVLGEVIGGRHIEPGNDSLDRLVDDFLRDRSALSHQAFDYYTANHSIDVVAVRFIEAARRSSFQYGDIDPELLRKGAIRKVYEFIRAGVDRIRRASATEESS